MRANKARDRTIHKHAEHSLFQTLADVGRIVYHMVVCMDKIGKAAIQQTDFCALWQGIGHRFFGGINRMAAFHHSLKTEIMLQRIAQFIAVQNDQLSGVLREVLLHLRQKFRCVVGFGCE
ncbi:hypothetical protein SDC9_207447 [bioreactor metagenome]|uniref:Uncharacterized protein n=1 Tax=bioreactor metagenome TaxID=1076179 RepID=A0A645J7P2_9ZZZZ